MTIALTVLHPAPDVLRTMLVSILMTAAAAIAHADTRTSTPSLIGGQLIAWLSSGSEEVADHASIAAGARAITPEMGFAPSLHHVSAGRPQHYADSAAGRVLYAFPVSDDASLGLHMGDDGYGASALSGAHGFGSGLAYSVNDSLAVTVGIDAIFFDTARSHRFNQYTDCVALEERGELPLLTCSDAIAYTPENLARGEPGTLDSNAVGYGYNLGATLAVTESTRLGMRYQSGMQLPAEDETVFHTAGPLLSTDLARLTDQAVISGLGLPGSFAVGASHQFNNQWSVAGDVTWVKWTQFNEFRVLPDGYRQGGGTTTENWENTYRYTLGLNYRQSDRLKYRLGAAYDQSPLPASERNTGLVASEDLVWLALGVGYSPTPRLSFDVG
nr:outer membrane protein transport protein [Gammaproteobacteria bacterium]